MVNADVLGIISVVAFVLAAFFAILSVVLFFKLKVRAIIDDLSGRKAERQIRAYREQGAISRKRVNAVSNQRDYYNRMIQKPQDITNRLSKDVGEAERTAILQDESTMVLDKHEQMGGQGYQIILDEVVVHTGEVL